MDANDHADIIRPILDEGDLDAEQVLAALVELLVRDHLIARAKANTTAINHPTTLWSVEKVIAERIHRQNGPSGGPIDPRLGTLAVLLVTCRERAEDQAERAKGNASRGDGDDEPPRMRLVRD